MPVPDYQTLMLPVLKLSSEGVIQFSDGVSRLANQFKLSEEEIAELLPSGTENA